MWDLTSAYTEIGGQTQRPADDTHPHYDPGGGTAVDAGDIPLSRGAIWLMANSISHVARPEEEGEWQYFSSSKKIGWKTGTSYGNRDAWAVRHDPRLCRRVWVGQLHG